MVTCKLRPGSIKLGLSINSTTTVSNSKFRGVNEVEKVPVHGLKHKNFLEESLYIQILGRSWIKKVRLSKCSVF